MEDLNVVLLHEVEALRDLVRETVDWRYKLLVRFAVAVVAVVIALKALYDSDADALLIVLTFGLGVGLSILLWFMDRHTGHVQRAAECRGTDLEGYLADEDERVRGSGYFSAVVNVPDPDFSRLLSVFYGAAAAVFLIGAVVAGVTAIDSRSDRSPMTHVERPGPPCPPACRTWHQPWHP